MKNGRLEYVRALVILFTIIGLVTLVLYLNKPTSVAVEQELTPIDNLNCSTETDSFHLLGSHITVVGVFEDYICVYVDKETLKITKANKLWEFYSFEHDPYHNLTGRSERKLTVGQYGVLIVDPRFEEDNQFLLLGETFNNVYGTKEDIEFSNMWFGNFVPKILAYTSKVYSEPFLTGQKEFSADFTPQDACYLAKEYSYAVKIDRMYSFCQYDNADLGHTHVNIAYLTFLDNGTELISIVPNKADKPATLKEGKEENGLKLVGCFSIEGYKKSILMNNLESVFIPYFQYKNEIIFGKSFFSPTSYYLDPVGVVFEVGNETVYDVIPFHTELQYIYLDGDAYIQGLYVLPTECDPNPSSFWNEVHQKLLWFLDRRIVISIK